MARGERLPGLQAFARGSSLHGLSHLVAHGSRSLRRLLWALAFGGSLALLALVCAERVAYFLSYPHVTKLDEVAAPNLTFPAVTLCNLNEFRFSKITRNDLYHVGDLLALLDARHEVAPLGDPELLAALRDRANFRGFKARPFDMADFYNRTGHDLAEMLWQCTFRGANCSASNFTVVRAGGRGWGGQGAGRRRGGPAGRGEGTAQRPRSRPACAFPAEGAGCGATEGTGCGARLPPAGRIRREALLKYGCWEEGSYRRAEGGKVPGQ
ncbi:acid-sensing ion channel 1C-like [Podarcis lilfordi]|uniref:Acid-sensing ion channel 1C-like n=1 Tax=Podarcis lilfordi TaxID=74358 RepID=A0AA35PIK7_9SAUR|nr:acid-sensing ion channel 1C-like [Podarcis lilfordi]